MKKEIEKYVRKRFNCETHYSGKQRIMYVKGARNESAMDAIRIRFNPSFMLRATKCLFIIGIITILFASCSTQRTGCWQTRGTIGTH